jgi:hypothetical protein
MLKNNFNEMEKLNKFQKITYHYGSDAGYIYIITNEKTWRNIPDKNFSFKVGKTGYLVNRMTSYGDEEFIYIHHLSFCARNMSIIEIEVLNKFKEAFVKENLLMGNEYFTGCIYNAQKIIIDVVSKLGNFEIQKDLVNNIWLGKNISLYKKIMFKNHMILLKPEDEKISEKYLNNEKKEKNKRDEKMKAILEKNMIDEKMETFEKPIIDFFEAVIFQNEIDINSNKKCINKQKNENTEDKKEDLKENNNEKIEEESDVDIKKNNKNKIKNKLQDENVEDKEKKLSYKQKWYKENAEKVAEYNKQKYLEKRDEFVHRAKKIYEKNKNDPEKK